MLLFLKQFLNTVTDIRTKILDNIPQFGSINQKNENNKVHPFNQIPAVSTLRCFSICGQIVGRKVQKAKNASFAVNLRQ